MTTDKEIRAVALQIFQPDAVKLEAQLIQMEKTHPHVRIRYNRNNEYDSSCMEIVLGLNVIGYVNTDDKRYVEPLLRERESCVAEFLEVYREKGHTPIIRFLITVDLDDVESLKAGEEWENWTYSGPVVLELDSLRTVSYTGNMIRDMLVNKTQDESVSAEELIEAFVDASLFDMSVETSIVYDDLLFYLEMSRNRNRQYINALQHGATVRRTDRVRDQFLEKWWPEFLSGEIARRLCKTFVVEMVKRHGSNSKDILIHEYEQLKAQLISLPYSLNEKLKDIKAMWATMYYTKIPRPKFLEVLSAMIVFTKLNATIEDNKPFIVEESRPVYIQNFATGSRATVING